MKGPARFLSWRWRWRLALLLVTLQFEFETSVSRSIGLHSSAESDDDLGKDDSNSSSYDDTVSVNVTTRNPCVLIGDSLNWATVVSLPLDGERGPLLVVTHPLFDVKEGIVPAITYKVSVTIPLEHEFTLEYSVLGLREDVRARATQHSKHRHGRERKHDELIQLDVATATAAASTNAYEYANETSSSAPSSGSEVVICTKNSIGSFKSSSSASDGETATTYVFDWYLLNGSGWFSPSSQVLFRLRLRSSSDAEVTTSVLEQTLKVNIKPECNLVVHVNQESQHVSMSSLWNSQADNSGLICTLSLIPAPSQGLEILISNLSVHGVRELCTERFLSFTTNRNLNNTKTRTRARTRTRTPQQYEYDDVGRQSESSSESGGVKFCGKLEDYSLAERTLTFTPQIKHKHKHGQDDMGLSSEGSKGDDMRGGMFVLVQIRLPGLVKVRETFSLEINSLSPCREAILTDLNGTLKYYDYEGPAHRSRFEECSIVIHVPYGYTIVAELSVLNVREENDTNAPFVEVSPLDSANLENSITVDSRHEDEDDPARAEAGDCVRTEAKLDNLLIIHALDVGVDEDRINRICFEANDQDNTRSRILQSQSNQLKFTFSLNAYFYQVVISYKSVRVSELTGDCDEGWVHVDRGCVLLLERATSWTQAEKDCQKQNAHLLTVRSEAASAEIEKMLIASPRFNPAIGYWIGANDRESEGNFQWSSGLSFLYTNWFGGWWHNEKEVLSAQPNDDGLSRQDCVELRDALSSLTFSHFHGATAKATGIQRRPSTSNLTWVSFEQSNKLPGSSGSQQQQLRFQWNDRNCEAKNFYICEKEIERDEDILCNQTIHFGLQQLSPVTITSPSYPSAYPDNIACFVTVETLASYKIIVTFDEFVLEESTGCNYDALELLEPPDGKSTRLCGDWTPKLKLLRYVSNSSSLIFKFESDFSHHFAGFRATVSTEKDTKHECSDQQMLTFENNCYLFVSTPAAATWKAAHNACTASKAQLASVLSFEEWNFLTKTLVSASNFDKRSAIWLGGSIDQSNQLVWTDRMPFNFSAFHQADLQSLADWKCLSAYWHRGPKETFAWKLADCKQKSGYVCKKSKQGDGKRSPLSKTFSGTGGKLASLNFPANYYNNLDYVNHLVAPKGTRIIVRFTHLDLEGQADCLYDYVEFIDRKTKNATRVCGSHRGSSLDRFDFLSSSNEVDIVFHSDYADRFSGFEMIWTAIDVTSCLSEKQIILTGQENQAYQHQLGTGQQNIHTPNFPYFNLRSVNCVFSVVAPAGYRILLRFDVFEIGRRRGESEVEDKCATGESDHVIIELGSENFEYNENTTDSEGSDKSDSSVRLCGNLTAFPQRTTFVSFQEKLRIRLFSPEGRTGRGFVGSVKAIPMNFNEQLSVPVAPNASFLLTSLNSPLSPPSAGNLTMSFTLPPNYIVTLRMVGVSAPNCDSLAGTTFFLIFRDPYDGVNGSSLTICQLRETPSPLLLTAEAEDEITGSSSSVELIGSNLQVIKLRTTFNRFEITQVYKSAGAKWSVEVVSSLDEQFRTKVLAGGDRLLLLNGCTPNPCANNGQCVTEDKKHICRCQSPFTGPFCGLTVCDLNPCLFGQCVLEGASFKCVCQMGYGGDRCDRRHRPCDDKPCTGHGECVELDNSNSTYKCLCFAFWQGPRCEERMQNIPYKPLSERMLKEPFWLGILTVFVVLGVIGLVFCLRRHFPEKLEKLLNEDLDKTRGISWVSGRSPSSLGFGGCGNYGMRESIAGTSQQSTSPQTTRSFLGRFGIRKPSLLSLSSANSTISAQVNSPHKYETRTFSLDDLLRPSRSMMMRTPSPHRRRNFSIHGRRDPVEKQQILQQLVSSTVHSSDGEGRRPPRKPTIGEIIQMSERRLRLASASSMQETLPSPSPTPSIATEVETSFITPTTLTLAQQKAEKKVTFARLLDKLTTKELSSSSSCSDISCPEDKIIIPIKIPTKKDRKGRFRRSKSYNRGRTSETESVEGVEMSSSDTTPDPIYTPKFPSRMCVSPTGLSVSATNSPTPKQSKSLSKIPSADSLLALFRRFSGSSSAPPSPQYSENEESSAGATPLSTPGSPRTSQLSLNIRPPAFHITTSEPTTVEVPVIDAQTNANWRSVQQACITLEVPLRDYCLSPIHEVPTPLPTPSHSPANSPMMQRQQTDTIPVIQIQASSEAEGDDEHEHDRGEEREPRPKQQNTGFSSLPFSIPKSFEIPMISISAEDDPDQQTIVDPDIDEKQKTDKISRRRRRMSESEMLPDVLIHVPPDVPSESAFSDDSMSPDPDTPRRTKNKPPPLVFANEILSYVKKPTTGDDEAKGPSYEIPVLNVESATPISDQTPSILPKEGDQRLPDLMPHLKQSQSSWEPHPLTPPIIMINQNSEPESDSDTVVRRLTTLRPSLTFLSPFSGATDRVPSESNLSTSGYSSMASPCPSRCPSVSPLCPLEMEDHLTHCQGCCKCHHSHFRRSSLTPSSSRKSSLTTSRRCSLNGTPIFTSHLYENSAMNFNENSENNLKDWSIDSAVDTDQEHELSGGGGGHAEGQSKTMSPISEEMKSIYSLLEVPRKTVPKSQSLDMQTSTGKQKTRLKGESLDSKLNSIDPAAFQNIFTFETRVLSAPAPPPSKEKESLTCGTLQEDQQKLSPMGSRSDSPLSDLGGAALNPVPAGGLLTPGTDTDGVYDGLSSEVPGNSSSFNLQTISPQQQLKRSGRRRNRRMSGSQNKNLLGVRHKSQSSMAVAGEKESPEGISLLPKDLRHRNMNVGAGASANSAGSSKRTSPKRRTRAQPDPGSSTSSSIESLNSLRSNASSPGFRQELPSTSEKLLPKSETPGAQIQSCDKPPRVRPKISRLKTISLQIRFLRRLEQNLIRKKESLAIFSRESSERRLSKTGSRQDSTSSSCTSGSVTCSCSCTGSCDEDQTDELHHGRSEDSEEEGVDEVDADQQQPLLRSMSVSSSSRRNAQGSLARTKQRPRK